MIQTAEPMEHAEDPLGLQRPVDQDTRTPAEEHADSVSDLAQARLVATPERASDVLLSDDPPQVRTRFEPQPVAGAEPVLRYPEWDYRLGGYQDPGVSVHRIPPEMGPAEWVEKTLQRHQALLEGIRRRFALLQARHTRVRRQRDGDAIDLQACVEAWADRRAGLAMPQGLYESHRRGQRDAAVLLLIDVSGSTDAWLTADQRIIDVEREALLLVSAALDDVGDPYAIQAFSGEGPQGVCVRDIKRFDERHGPDIARRIASLEPDRYTRAGAALRHASATLMKQPAHHRLLLLSDGKPNDADHYEGRYGIEDMRQAAIEAKLQGLSLFCLTVDHTAADYLPRVFGAGHYALLPKSQHLPAVLLDWMRRLLVH